MTGVSGRAIQCRNDLRSPALSLVSLEHPSAFAIDMTTISLFEEAQAINKRLRSPCISPALLTRGLTQVDDSGILSCIDIDLVHYHHSTRYIDHRHLELLPSLRF